MRTLKTRTLNCGVVCSLEVHDQTTVKELKHLLKAENEQFKGCKLIFNQIELNDDQTVGSLALDQGSFVTALLRTQRRGQVAVRHKLRGDGRRDEKCSPKHPQKELMGPSDALDTLLPGYESRPMRSPVKPPMVRQQILGTEAPLFNDLRRQSLHESGETHDIFSGAVAETSSGDLDVPWKRSSLPNDAAAAQVPLPPYLRKLEKSFGQLCAIYDFLMHNHIPSTWLNINKTLNSLGLDLAVTLDDIKCISGVCPEVVQFVSLAPAAGWSDAPDAWRCTPTLSKSPQQQPILLKTDVRAQGEANRSHSSKLVIPKPGHLSTDDSGTDLRGNTDAMVEMGYSVVVSDPWNTAGRPPKNFVLEMSAARGREGLDHHEGVFEDDGDGTHDEYSQTVVPKKNKSRESPSPRVNKRMRQAWAFRLAAVQLTAFLQDQHFKRDGVPPLSANDWNSKIDAVAKRRRSRHGKEKLAAEALGTKPRPGGRANQQPANPDLNQLLSSGSWHPAFPIHTFETLESIHSVVQIVRNAANESWTAALHQTDPFMRASTSRVRGWHANNKSVEEESSSKRQRKNTAPPQILKKHPPCTDRTKFDCSEFLEHLQSLPGYNGQIVHVENIPGRAARHQPLCPPLTPAAAAALSSRGIASLFSHQTEAITSLRSGRHTVISTSTASGKSVCYTVPIVESLEADPATCAMLVFPTKALAQDQLRALRELSTAAFGSEMDSRIAIYDGDTPMSDRNAIRENVQILITNPDMLHYSILPVHSQFARLLRNLRFVVVDEAHAYKGVFGGHVALVLRRLHRLCHTIYGASPTFAAATATIANPREHALTLLGVSDVVVVSEDGSPHSCKQFVLWNPALLNSESPEKLKPMVSQAKRTEQERQRSILRGSRQQRHCGARLGGPEFHQAQWEATVASGQRDPLVKAALKIQQSPLGKQRQLSAREKDMAAQAMSILSAVRGASSKAVTSLPTCGTAMIRATERQLVKIGPLSAAKNPSRSGSVDEQEQADEAEGTPMSQSTRVTARFPETAAAKARYGAAGVPPESRRSSSIVEIALLLAECVQHGLRTIAFCKTRKLSELVAAYCREVLATTAPELEGTVAVYRAGYSPSERRKIEAALVSGTVLGVAATNALELGIDIGGLDCTLHLGFPGTIASLWQQAGRAGRREETSLSIYVGWDGPLDQYFLSNPDALFGRPVESAMLDPGNPATLRAHLACAALELPLCVPLRHPQEMGNSEERSEAAPSSSECFGSGFKDAVQDLLQRGVLGRHPSIPGQLHYIGVTDCPASKISLRAIDPVRYAIMDESTGGTVLEEVEECKAFYSVYDGAVYMAQGRTYLCKHVDLDAKVAIVRPASLKYYTQPIDYTDVHVVGGDNAYVFSALSSSAQRQQQHSQCGTSTAACGRALVTTRWLGYNRVWRGTGHVFDTVDLFLPDVQYETEATHLRLPAAARRRVEAVDIPFRDSVHAAAHAVLNVLPLFVMCNSNDVGTECDNPYNTRFKPERILIYDKHPGGIGLAAAARPVFTDILRRALALVSECECGRQEGCPECVQHTDCGEYNSVLHKEGGRLVLEAALEMELERHGARGLVR